MAVTKDEILSKIREYVSTHQGAVPGERAFATATGIRPWAYKGRYWVRWKDALGEAGYGPNAKNQRIPDGVILQKLSELLRELGHFPVRDELVLRAKNLPGFPVWSTIKKRYGGMAQTATALLEFARERGDGRLAELCEERLKLEAAKPTPSPTGMTGTAAKPGFVYLKYSPSLRLYKIGKADDPDKRGAGISLLLPEDLVPKHEIKTDYPFVLETYWKKRFRAKKKQGEWYDLTTEDIETFKARREFIFAQFFP